jgi:predicted nucleotidyltransferase
MHMPITQQLRKYIQDSPYTNLITKASLFGSYLRNEATSDSDVDVLVSFDPKEVVGFFEMADIKNYLEEKMQKKIDLVPEDALSPYFRDDVINNAQIVYER